MANPFVKGWKYVESLLGAKLDEHADPKVQIQQAIEQAQRQHQTLVAQAASVIGNQRQLEMKLARQRSSVEEMQSSTREALLLADAARADGDEARAEEFERAGQTFATRLVTGEQALTELAVLHQQATGAAAAAKKAVEDNAYLLEQRFAERTRLLSQLEQAKMQEQVAASQQQMSALTAPGSTPTLADVRDKIEARYATALGRAELAQESPENRIVEVRRASLDRAAAERLAQIRSTIGAGAGAGAGAVDVAAVGPGGTSPAPGTPAGPEAAAGNGARPSMSKHVPADAGPTAGPTANSPAVPAGPDGAPGPPGAPDPPGAADRANGEK